MTAARIRWGLMGLLGMLAMSAQADEGGLPDPWWERSIWGDPERAYKWYPPDLPPPPESKPETAKPKHRNIRALKSVRAIREELDRLKDVAVMTPTSENVRRFLDAQQFVMEKGAVFADVARRVVWASPELDYSLRRPTQNAAIQTWKIQRQADETEAVAAAMRSHGLYFFLRGDCPYCHQLAPVLKYLEATYGMEVFPISLDGAGLPGFPAPRPDNGIARLLGVTTVPALYLMPRDATTGNVPIPLGQGMLSADEIGQPIQGLTQPRPGESF